MAEFSLVTALAGGLMIGAAASLFLLLDGRIAGISGIAGGLLRPSAGNVVWEGRQPNADACQSQCDSTAGCIGYQHGIQGTQHGQMPVVRPDRTTSG